MIKKDKRIENQFIKTVEANRLFFGGKSEEPFFQAKPLANPLGNEREQGVDNLANPTMNIQTGRGPVLPGLPMGCSKNEKKTIRKGLNDAQKMVNKALNELNNPHSQIFLSNFGNQANRQIVNDRFKHISSNLHNKNIVCSPCTKEALSEAEIPGTQQTPDHVCGFAPCSGNTIFLCPPVFQQSKNKNGKLVPNVACPIGRTIVHEAAHNAGACEDILPSSPNYPPLQNGENNAWSYELFAFQSP